MAKLLHYRQVTTAIYDDDTQQVVSDLLLTPYSEDTQPPEKPLPIAASVLVDGLAVRSEPFTRGGETTVQTRLPKGANIFIDRLDDETPQESKYEWAVNVLDVNQTRIGDYVAIRNPSTGTQFLDLSEVLNPPKILTGDIQPVQIISPTGAKSWRFKIGDSAWSHDPKLGVCTRSLAVSRQAIQQFWYEPDKVYINQTDDEYLEMLYQANNETQSNPTPFNAADYWFYAVHNEYMDSDQKQDELVRLIEKQLNDLAPNHMLGGIVLKDDIRHIHNINSEKPYHTFGSDGRLNEAYYANNVYETTFIPFLHKLMARIGKHPALGYIQANNEPHVAQSEQSVMNYLRFIKRVRAVVREYNTTSPFGLRLENSDKIKWNGATNDHVVSLFAPYVDFWQCHMYPEYNAVSIHDKWENQDRVYDDLFRLAPLYQLPTILDEVMIRHENANILVTNGSTEQLKVRLIDMFDRGLGKAVLWGYCQGSRDTRLTDNRGMTNVLSNYKGYYDVRNLVYQLTTVILPNQYRWQIVPEV